MTKEKKVLNLNLSNMKKEDKKLNDQEEITVLINDNPYKLKIDTKFRTTKKNKVLNDLIKFLEAGHKDKELYTIATPYTSLLIIKHFTNLEIPEDIDEALDYLNLLIDLKVLDDILNAMPDGEVVELYEDLRKTMNQITDNMMETTNEANEILHKIEDKIENPQVKELFLGEQSE